MTERYIGLMSGTSLDGVDAVLVEFDAAGTPRATADFFVAYPQAIRQAVLQLQPSGHDELARSAQLGNELARLYAEAVHGLLAAQQLSPAAITAIGCHGQTVRHAPQHGYTLQIGNLSLLAELTGIDVIGDFRSRDVAAQGQGAPLVPAFHQSVFASPTENRVILNIGGISNLTRLADAAPVIGFDCGPGNMLMDAWCQQHLGHAYDRDGQWAASGQVHADLLTRCLQEPFFAQQPPKSTGRDLFDLAWLAQQLAALPGELAPADVQRTLLELTVTGIATAIRQHCPQTRAVYVCGGGANNRLLMQRLAEHLPESVITTTATLGLPVHQVEAAAFGWLAFRFTHRLSANLPEVTGASGARILGALYPH